MKMNREPKLVRLPDGWTEKYIYLPKYYDSLVKMAYIWGLIVAIFLCLVSMFIIIGAIDTFISEVIVGKNLLDIEIVMLIIGLLGLILYILYMAGVAYSGFRLNMADIATFDEGIWLQTLGKRGVFVPWESFHHVRIFKVRHYTWRSPFDRGANSFAINVPGLTIFHRFLGAFYGPYGLFFKPVFVVTPDHENYKKLLDLIKDKQLRMEYQVQINQLEGSS